MKTKLYASLAVSALALALAGSAQAAVIYNGATFSLSLESFGEDTDNNTYTYDFKYTADFTGWTGPDTQKYIAAVNFKPDTGQVPTDFKLMTTTAPGTWSIESANATNQGCTGGADSFVCSEVNPLDSAATTGDPNPIYEWVFWLTYDSLLTANAFTNAPIRAWFVDGEGGSPGGTGGSGLLSMNTDITFNGNGEPPFGIPEPATLGLLGIGLFGLGMATYRRRRLASTEV